MKKVQKIVLIISFVVLLTFIVIYFMMKDTPNVETPADNIQRVDEDDEEYDKKSTLYYSCTKNKTEEQFVTVEYYYNFSYLYNNVQSSYQMIKFNFKDNNSFDNFNVESGFSKDMPDDNQIDKNQLTKSYMWNTVIPQDSANPTIDNYLKQLESLKYSCVVSDDSVLIK